MQEDSTHINSKSTRQFTIHEYDGNSFITKHDVLAIEAPLEIRIVGPNNQAVKSISITMRTPCDDGDLALGFLSTEGILKDYKAIYNISQVESKIISVFTNEDFDDTKMDRNFYVSSSCGVCGKGSIDSIYTESNYSINKSFPEISCNAILKLKDQLLSKQSLFKSTGGIHAAAIFDNSGKFEYLREDVGRHNALDKIIGHAWQNDLLPLENKILLLSGRASFELIQKAKMAGIAMIVAVGAPSSMAYDSALKNGQTLVGFVSSKKFNIYTGHERIKK